MESAIYYKAQNVSTDKIIACKVKIVQSFKSRSIGLLDRSSLKDNEGLLIKPCNSIHTFFMKFSIDVLFLNKAGKVMKIRENVQPFRLAGCFSGFMTLELPVGVVKMVGVKNGDLIEFKPNDTI